MTKKQILIADHIFYVAAMAAVAGFIASQWPNHPIVHPVIDPDRLGVAEQAADDAMRSFVEMQMPDRQLVVKALIGKDMTVLSNVEIGDKNAHVVMRGTFPLLLNSIIYNFSDTAIYMDAKLYGARISDIIFYPEQQERLNEETKP